MTAHSSSGVTIRTPNVFMIGAGPVGTALAGALRQGGVPVLGLWGRRPDAVRQASSASGVAAFSAAPPDLILEADCLIIAVRDDAISQVAGMLLETGLVTRRHVLLHCSGAVSSGEVFADVATRVGGIGTMHPLRAIVDAKRAAATMRGTVFGVEGDPAGRLVAQELVRHLGGTALDIDGEGMALYHAAASIASNFLVALVGAAAEALGAAGVAREEAMAALLPLLEGTIENVRRVGLPGALTGPIARGDAGTVDRHLKALGERAPGLVELYRVVGRRALELARAKGDAAAPELDLIQHALAGKGPAPIS
jgi:predicted short-subunit dehydrogenase-like oxidoreductase (DUF2520 family)